MEWGLDGVREGQHEMMEAEVISEYGGACSKFCSYINKSKQM